MFEESRPETELSEEPPLPHALVTMVDTNCPHQFPWIPPGSHHGLPLIHPLLLLRHHQQSFHGQLISVKRLLHKARTFLCGETAPTAFSTAILGLFPADSLVKR